MVRAPQASDRSGCSVHHRLQTTELVRRDADQRDVVVVKPAPAQYQCDDKRLVDGRQDCISVAKQLATVRWTWVLLTSLVELWFNQSSTEA